MTDMYLDSGEKLAAPRRRTVHRYSWQWAREGSADCSCIEVVYPNPMGGERMFLHMVMGKNDSGIPSSGNPYPVAEFLFAAVNHYLNDGWRIEHCDATAAVLVHS